MLYRVCLSPQPSYLMMEKPKKWEGDQVHSMYPEITGVMAEFAYLFLTTVLGNSAPNMTIVTESLTGSVGSDGVPSGCYASIHNNKSDITVMPVEYPILEFEKVDPIQVLYEGPLTIFSTYQVEAASQICYADILQSSLKSFDKNIWSMVVVIFVVFTALLLLRKFLKKDTTGYSAVFETFCHMIGQDNTDFDDRSGKMISIVMTIGFFMTVTFYSNLMSTDLVVVTKPHVINNYRDIMNEKDVGVAFLALTFDKTEFETAKEGTIQEELWKQFNNTHVTIDSGQKIESQITNWGLKVMKNKGVMLFNSMYSEATLKFACKLRTIVQHNVPIMSQIYAWMSSDPEGSQHTIGLIMRQGLTSDLITKGIRRLQTTFERAVTPKIISESLAGFDCGPFCQGTSNISEAIKCMSKQVNYNQAEIDAVNVLNFMYLIVLCGLLFLISFAVLILEHVDKVRQITRDQPI